MQAVSFSCPHCSIVLRLQDRMFVGTTIDCPDCGESIDIVSDAKDSITAEKRESSVVADTDADASAESHASAAIPLATRLSSLATPVGIAWTIAGIFAVSMVVAVWPSGNSGDNQSAAAIVKNNEVGESNSTKEESSAVDAEESGKSKKEKKEDVAETDPNRALIINRFEKLGIRIKDYVERNERFPTESLEAAELPLNDRLGWLAQLTADADGGRTMQPLWDRAWRDPLNDRFVRRRIREFQNPLVKETVSLEGYPATHMVGISGVGANAEKYPKTDKRAGIFGLNRHTNRDDVSDGLSNTMMVAGVRHNVGAWAAAGPASMRSFTAEPYINGPDGFGTGQHDGMMVLMADGSVRFVSRKVEPVIIRRMAAMADGFPLDPSVRGEPGDMTKPAIPLLADAGKKAKPKADGGVDKVKKDAEPANKKDGQAKKIEDPKLKQDPPLKIAPPIPEPEPKVDVKAALAQKIVSFRQSKPVAFVTLIMQVEEMAGVKIRYTDAKLKREILEKPVTVSLSDTTVGAILDAAVQRVGITYDARDTGIFLRNRDSSDDTEK